MRRVWKEKRRWKSDKAERRSTPVSHMIDGSKKKKVPSISS
jgi:hypothetical protein